MRTTFLPARRWTGGRFRPARTEPAATGQAAPKAPPWSATPTARVCATMPRPSRGIRRIPRAGPTAAAARTISEAPAATACSTASPRTSWCDPRDACAEGASCAGEGSERLTRAPVLSLSSSSGNVRGTIFLAFRILASAFAGSRIGQGDKIVVADALQDQKHRGRIAGVGDEVRALRRNGISLSRRQSHLFLRTLKKDSNGPRHDIERVVDVGVIVPGHLLRRADLQFGDAKPWTRRVIGSPLRLV